MNEKAVFEIGDLIHVKYGPPYKFLIFGGTKLSAKEVTETHEYKMFKKHHPEICRLAENGG